MRCIKCDGYIDVDKHPGALVFSPPGAALNTGNHVLPTVAKIHVCADCWPDLLEWLEK